MPHVHTAADVRCASSPFLAGLLSVLLFACAPNAPPKTVGGTRAQPADREVGGFVDAHPYCQRAAPMPSCAPGGCPEASDCVAGQCVPLWDADCAHRCAPGDVPDVLCQGNSAHHGVFRDGRLVRYIAVRVPSAVSNCGRSAWRVYDVSPDLRSRSWLDSVSLGYWFSPVFDCEKGSVARYERPDLLASPSAANWAIYLLVADGGGGPREVQP